jgi:threonine/homoserine/homoserine lactone efflux protein
MTQHRGLWFGILLIQLLCVGGAFALRESYPNLSIACWVVFGLLLVYKYVVMFRRSKQASENAEREMP